MKQKSKSLHSDGLICSFAGVLQCISPQAFRVEFVLTGGRTWPSCMTVKPKSKTAMRFNLEKSGQRPPSVARACMHACICNNVCVWKHIFGQTIFYRFYNGWWPHTTSALPHLSPLLPRPVNIGFLKKKLWATRQALCMLEPSIFDFLFHCDHFPIKK